MRRRQARPLLAASPVVLGALAAFAAAAAGCQPERTEYHYRPSFMTDPNAPKEATLADGTKVVFVDTPYDAAAAERAANAPVKQPKLGPDGKPLPVKQFTPREVEKDGTVVLRNFTPDHVVANAMECFRMEEYKLMWDQLLAPETRAAYEERGGYAEFADWCRTNRRPTMELLNRMRFNVLGSDVVMDKAGTNRMRARLSPHLWDQFQLRVIEFEMTNDGMKLRAINPE